MRRLLFMLLLCSALTAGVASAETWVVLPDSTGDAPTIEAGIDSAGAGDTVMVMCGAYYEHDITLKSGIYLASETGLDDCVTIDAQGLGRVFNCILCDSTTTIVGFTLTNGEIHSGRGGGMYCGSCDMKITNCNFHENYCDSLGGGVFIYQGSTSGRSVAANKDISGKGGAK